MYNYTYRVLKKNCTEAEHLAFTSYKLIIVIPVHVYLHVHVIIIIVVIIIIIIVKVWKRGLGSAVSTCSSLGVFI